MKQRFNSIPILLFSALSGFLGLGLQLWQNITGIDAEGLYAQISEDFVAGFDRVPH